MKIIITLLSIFLIQNIYSQKTDGICFNDDYYGIPVENIEYIRYSKTIIKDRYKSFKEVKNSTTEELIKSMYSATNNDWVSFNYGQDMNWQKNNLIN